MSDWLCFHPFYLGVFGAAVFWDIAGALMSSPQVDSSLYVFCCSTHPLNLYCEWNCLFPWFLLSIDKHLSGILTTPIQKSYSCWAANCVLCYLILVLLLAHMVLGDVWCVLLGPWESLLVCLGMLYLITAGCSEGETSGLSGVQPVSSDWQGQTGCVVSQGVRGSLFLLSFPSPSACLPLSSEPVCTTRPRGLEPLLIPSGTLTGYLISPF